MKPNSSEMRRKLKTGLLRKLKGKFLMKRYPPLEITAPVLFAFIFALTLIYSRLEPHVEDVGAAYVREHAGKPGYILIDARTEEEYLGKSPRPGVPGGHIPGAINFPIGNLELRTQIAAGLLAKEGITKNKIVIIYCNTGVLAGRFADQLVRRFNFSSSNIKNYRGSTVEWVKDPQNILLPPEHETGLVDELHYQKFRGK